MIAIGQTGIGDPLADFFEEEFGGWPCHAEWTSPRLDQLKKILSEIQVWKTHPRERDCVGGLTLDSERLQELTEAWVPVHSPYGPAVPVIQKQ